MTARHDLRARLGLAVAGIALAFGALELAVRAWPLPPTDLRGLHVVRPDRPWLFGLRPGARHPIAGTNDAYEINADGFRGHDVVVPKPAGTFRIAMVGDSLTFGYGVRDADALPAQLASRLQPGAPATARIEILNLGVSGYNPYTEAALLADVGPRYAPDLVLVQFCVNDLNDPTMHFDFSTRTLLPDLPAAAFPDPGVRPPSPSRRQRWCARSRLCTLVRDRLESPAEALARSLPAIAPHAQPSAIELAWLAARYGEMAATARALGAGFGLVVFPFEQQLAAEAPTTLQAALADIARTHDWLFVDVLPALRAARAADDAPLFIDLWHPTARGYAAAADAIAHTLGCSGRLPWRAPGCAPAAP